jgi:hypothetical protein
LIRYIENEFTIVDRTTGAAIPKDSDLNEYGEYLDWLDEGNTPIPAQPSPDHVLPPDADAWEIDPAAVNNRELAEAKAGLRASDLQLFEFLLALWQVLKDKGVVVNTDIDATLRQKAAEWKTHLDRIAAG